MSRDIAQYGQPGVLAQSGHTGEVLSPLMDQGDPTGFPGSQVGGTRVLVEISQVVLWLNMGGDRETSRTADSGSDGLPQLQLQTTDKAGADQGANQGRYRLPHGLEELEEGRAGGVGEAGATSRLEGAGRVLSQCPLLGCQH